MSRLTEITKTTVSGTLPDPALGPIRLDFRSLVGILQSLLVFGLRRVDGRAVGVEDVVRGLDSDSLGELFTIESISCGPLLRSLPGLLQAG